MKKRRVLWLLNHDTLSKFELPLLVELGFEVFTPKNVDSNIIEWSGSVTYEYDKTLSLDQDIIDRLNSINFYRDNIDRETINLINQHFDIALCMFNIEVIKFLARDFEGNIFIRAFGLDKDRTYYKTLNQFVPESVVNRINQIKNRIWFSQCYENLSEVEKGIFKDNAVYMPLGLPEEFYKITDTWEGREDKILFFCSRINVSPYYKDVYEKFKKDFKGFKYSIAGNQPVEVKDPNVLGFLKREEIDDLFKKYKVMYYHSEEPRHLHYHPLEAMIAGMPVIYMKGGMLESLAKGCSQPGRANSIKEAREKIARILKNDQKYIAEVIKTQQYIMSKFSMEYNLDQWKKNFLPLIMSAKKAKKQEATKIGAFILDQGEKDIRKYINHLLLIDKAIKEINSDNEIILGVTSEVYKYLKLELDWVFKKEISIREIEVNFISYNKLKILNNFNFNESQYSGETYVIPDDKRKNFIDADKWLFMGNAYNLPIAPVKPYWIYCDCIEIRNTSDITIRNIKNAEVIFTNNVVDKELLITAMGINSRRIYKLPYTYYTSQEVIEATCNKNDYILLVCEGIKFNKNEHNLIENLERKYKYGNLKGKVKILTSNYLVAELKELVKKSQILRKNVKIESCIDEYDYINMFRNASEIIIYPTSTTLSMDIITAIQFNKKIYSIINPFTKYIMEYFNYSIYDYSQILNPRETIECGRSEQNQVNYMEEEVLKNEIKIVMEKIL